jgi:hypothetical protein
MEQLIEIQRISMFADGRLTALEAAKYLGLAPKTLAIMRSEGRGPAYLKRGRIYYYREDLDRWLRAGRNPSGTDIATEGSASR